MSRRNSIFLCLFFILFNGLYLLPFSDFLCFDAVIDVVLSAGAPECRASPHFGFLPPVLLPPSPWRALTVVRSSAKYRCNGWRHSTSYSDVRLAGRLFAGLKAASRSMHCCSQSVTCRLRFLLALIHQHHSALGLGAPVFAQATSVISTWPVR